MVCELIMEYSNLKNIEKWNFSKVSKDLHF